MSLKMTHSFSSHTSHQMFPLDFLSARVERNNLP